MLRLLFSRAHGLYIGTRNREFFAHYGIPDRRLHFVPYCVAKFGTLAVTQAVFVKIGATRSRVPRATRSGPKVSP